MHPILFRIPLPHMPLKLWWALAAVAAIAVVFAALALRRRDRSGALSAAVVAAAAAGGAYKWQTVAYESPNVPIYAYGVMLGISLVVGWYLTLPLSERDGLPKETMANCYVVTALAALAGSRILYAITNPDEFKSVTDLFALRNGGLVAYGGFIGGLLGSWAFLAPKKIRLLAWADDAVPSLASGLMITRIGCYLFGCDFGQRLPDNAPHFLKTLSPLGGGHARERRREPGVRAAPRGVPRHAARDGPRAHEHELPRASDAALRVAGRADAPPPSPLAAPVHAVPRAGLLPLRVRLRVPALPSRDVARRRRARQLRADARQARVHPAVPPADGHRVRLRHLARHRQQARAHHRPRAGVRAAGRRCARGPDPGQRVDGGPLRPAPSPCRSSTRGSGKTRARTRSSR